jgi:hypothetical protein
MCLVIVFLMVTRRGWWKPTGDETDWTTTDGCPRCWEYGPFPWWQMVSRHSMTSTPEQARELHQEWHTFVAVMARPFVRMVEWGGRKMRRP